MVMTNFKILVCLLNHDGRTFGWLSSDGKEYQFLADSQFNGVFRLLGEDYGDKHVRLSTLKESGWRDYSFKPIQLMKLKSSFILEKLADRVGSDNILPWIY